jgi:hypothetical protein
MACDKFNALHLKLARKIFDPVATAATDGQKVTSLLRTDYLNRANKQIQLMIWSAGHDKVNDYLQGLITLTVVDMLGGVGDLPLDFSFRLAFQKTAGGRFEWVEPERWADIENANNPNDTAVWTIIGSEIKAWENGAAITDGLHNFYYIKDDQRVLTTDDNDIAIDSLWHDVLVDLAASFHFEDRGEYQAALNQLSRVKSVVQSIIGG